MTGYINVCFIVCLCLHVCLLVCMLTSSILFDIEFCNTSRETIRNIKGEISYPFT